MERDYIDPSNILNLLVSTYGGNDGRYENADYDNLADKAAKKADAAERSALLHAQEDLLMEDTACIPVAYYSAYWLQSPKLTGSWHSSGGFWYFMYADVTK